MRALILEMCQFCGAPLGACHRPYCTVFRAEAAVTEASSMKRCSGCGFAPAPDCCEKWDAECRRRGIRARVHRE